MALLVKNPQASAVDLRDTGLIPVFDPLEEDMKYNPLKYMPAWRIPWTEEPGGWQSMGLQRIIHD